MAKVDRKELLTALQTVKPAIPTNEDPDVNKKVVIQGRMIIGLSEDLVIIYPVSKTIPINSIAAPYDELVALVSNSSSQNIDLSMKKDKLILIDNNLKVTLRVDTDNRLFDDLESIEALLQDLPDELSEYSSELGEAIKLCMYNASKETIQAILSCVHVAGNVVESSDDYRISRCTLPTEFDGDVLIPAKICKHIVKFAPTGYSVSDSWVLFEKILDDARSAFILSRQVALEYNSVDEFIKVQGKKCTLPKRLSHSIGQVGVLATGEFDIEKTIRVEISSDKVLVLAESDKGLAESTLESEEISWKDDPIVFYTNPEFLSEILAKTNTMVVGDNRILFEYDSFEHVLCISTKIDE